MEGEKNIAFREGIFYSLGDKLIRKRGTKHGRRNSKVV
jgi:hypothetical protein